MTPPKPSVVFINRVLPPDPGATGHRLTDMAKGLVQRGWDVTILTTTPSPLPIDGVVILSQPFFSSTPGTGIWRWIVLLTAYISLGRQLWKLRPHDITVTMTDPPLFAVWAGLIRKHLGKNVVHWCQDMYPDLPRVLMGWKGRLVSALTSPLMRWGLRRHDRVIAIGECMRQRLEEKGFQAPIECVRNPADPVIHPLPRATPAERGEFNISGDFVVAYAGTAGAAHTLNDMLEAAAFFQSIDPGITFMVSGMGRQHPFLKQAVQDRGLKNVVFQPWVSHDRLSKLLAVADLHVVTMLPSTLGMLVPSKAAGVMAAGRPCIFIGPPTCDVARIVDSSQNGYVVEPGYPSILVDTIRRYRHDKNLWQASCQRSLEAARTYYAAHVCADRMHHALSRGL